jgi:hypothetical protein
VDTTSVRDGGTRAATCPHRWVRRVVVSTIAVLVGILVFSGVYLSRYQPLIANGTGATWVDPRYATDLGTFTPPEGRSFSAYRVRYEEGRVFRYALTLHNDGPLPVTITSVGDENCDGCVFPLVFAGATIGAPEGAHRFDLRYATPFTAFVLDRVRSVS